MFSGNDTENYYFWSRLSISSLENSIFWFNLHFSINNEVNFSFLYTSFLHRFLCELFHHVPCPSLYWHMMGREAVWPEITRRIKRLFIHLDILLLLYPKMSSCEEGRPISYNSFGGKSQKSNSNYSIQKEQKKEFTGLVTDMPWCSSSFRCGLIKSLKQWLKNHSLPLGFADSPRGVMRASILKSCDSPASPITGLTASHFLCFACTHLWTNHCGQGTVIFCVVMFTWDVHPYSWDGVNSTAQYVGLRVSQMKLQWMSPGPSKPSK